MCRHIFLGSKSKDWKIWMVHLCLHIYLLYSVASNQLVYGTADANVVIPTLSYKSKDWLRSYMQILSPTIQNGQS